METLDNYIHPTSDTQLIYIGISDNLFIKIHVGPKGMIKAIKSTNHNETDVSDKITVVAKKYESTNKNKNGYIVEFAFKKSLLSNNINEMRVNPILYNRDQNMDASKADIIANTKKFTSWIPLYQ